MPKTKKKDFSKAKYTDLSTLYNELKELDTLDKKLEHITKSVLNYDFSKDHDYSYAAIIQQARSAIAKQAKIEKDNLAAEMFIANPAEYLKNEAKQVSKDIDEDNVLSENNNKLKENCQNVINRMDEKFNSNVFELDKKAGPLGVKTRLEASFGGKKGLDDVIKAAQPNWFSRLTASYSPQWSNLEEAYEVFNSPIRNGFGNKEYLNDAANDYLKHKFKKWNPGEEIPAKAYSKLSKNEMAKVNFAVGVLNALKDQVEAENSLKDVMEASKNKDIDLSKEDSNKKDINQSEFQNKLIEDLSHDEDLINDSMEESMDIEINKEKDENILDDDEDFSLDSLR